MLNSLSQGKGEKETLKRRKRQNFQLVPPGKEKKGQTGFFDWKKKRKKKDTNTTIYIILLD